MGIVFGTQKQASMHAFGAPTVLSVHAITRAVRALRVISNDRLRSASVRYWILILFIWLADSGLAETDVLCAIMTIIAGVDC